MLTLVYEYGDWTPNPRLDDYQPEYMVAGDTSIPDLADDATGGCLLAMLGPGWACAHGVDVWSVAAWPDAPFDGQSLAEAAARALVAIGRVP